VALPVEVVANDSIARTTTWASLKNHWNRLTGLKRGSW